MAPSTKSSGKCRRRDTSSSNEPPSSDVELTMPPLTQPKVNAWQPKKKRRQTSPERVLQSALVKMKDAGGSSGSTGLNKFAALMADHKGIDAAMDETTRGMKGKGKVVGKSIAAPKATRGTTMDANSFRVGRIVFLVAGIRKTRSDELPTETFAPVYATKREVDVTPSALIGLIQNNLCKVSKTGYIFSVNDSFEVVDAQLRKEFPLLFVYLDENLPSTGFQARLSPWLVCMRRSGHHPGVLVYSSDHDGNPPNGLDVVTASTINKNKSNFSECTLFLVTRDPIPQVIVHKWSLSGNPELEEYRNSLGDTSDHDESDCDSIPEYLAPQSTKTFAHSRSLSPVAGPSRILRSQSGTMTYIPPHDVISLSSGGSSPKDFTTPPPRVRGVLGPGIELFPIPSTPPHNEPIESIFTSSMLLDDKADPWGAAAESAL